MQATIKRGIIGKIKNNINSFKQVINHPLNRPNRKSAIIRWLRWKLAVLISPGPLVVPYIGNLKLVSHREFTSVTKCVFWGLGEFEDMGFVLHALRPDDLFCDIGANAGIFTVLASGTVGARSIAFEPVPSTYDVLCDNIRINHLDKLANARNEGLGSERGTLLFTNNLVSFNHVVEHEGPNVSPIMVDTLDNALDGAVPLVIKLDVEGFEYHVLKGAAKTLASSECNVVLVELGAFTGRYGVVENNILSLMKDYGFIPTTYSPFERKLVVVEGRNITGSNTIFIRDIEAIKERIKSAPIAVVNGVKF